MAGNGNAVKVLGDQREIGKTVKAARESAGFSMTSFAKKVGMSQAQISRLEDGQQGFRTKTMQKIAKALDIPIVIYFGPKTKVAALMGKS